MSVVHTACKMGNNSSQTGCRPGKVSGDLVQSGSCCSRDSRSPSKVSRILQSHVHPIYFRKAWEYSSAHRQLSKCPVYPVEQPSSGWQWRDHWLGSFVLFMWHSRWNSARELRMKRAHYWQSILSPGGEGGMWCEQLRTGTLFCAQLMGHMLTARCAMMRLTSVHHWARLGC